MYIHVYNYIYICICVYTHTHSHTQANTNPMMSLRKISVHYQRLQQFISHQQCLLTFWPKIVLINYFKFVNLMEEKCLYYFNLHLEV